MDINYNILFSKCSFNRLFERLHLIHKNFTCLVYWNVQMNWELNSFCLKSFLSFRELSLSFFWIVKTILTICKIHTRPLITISWKLIHYHCSEIFTICLNKVWFNKDITNSCISTFFTIQLSRIICTINGKS